MIDSGLKGVDLYAVNTDAQALEEHDQTTRIQIGANITKGLGAGADPKIGKKAAQESIEELKSYLKGINMLFITACMEWRNRYRCCSSSSKTCKGDGYTYRWGCNNSMEV